VISQVDGEPMYGHTVEQVAERVRGRAGTTVHLGLRREGEEELIEVDLIRANIPRPSVPLAYFVRPTIGYLRIKSFGETTAEEVDDALERMQGERLKGLILDLRDNQGGLLTAGVHVADKFLDRDQKIVSHHGRASEERVYRAKRGNEGELYPVVVLVNCGSASAAEIVAGALQDHDRALIVGASTFGKGLVQSVFDLSQRAGLVLTTARYYTPSGRMIQRPYDNVFQWDYYTDPCRNGYQPPRTEPRLTDKGRPVYGGAGITPDVGLDELRKSDFQRLLEERRAYQGFAQLFRKRHKTLQPGWEPNSETLAEFGLYLENEGLPLDPAGFQAEEETVRRLLMLHIYTTLVDIDEGTRVYTEHDPVVRRAIELLPEARALLEPAGSQVASRR
jgi:carboxyl-terminal processing protease